MVLFLTSPDRVNHLLFLSTPFEIDLLLQLPRCWGFVHFPPTPEGERAAKDAIQALNGTTISEMKV